MRTLANIFLGMLIVLVIGFAVFAAFMVDTEKKRRLLIRTWSLMAGQKNITLPEAYIYRQLSRLNPFDINKLVKFTIALERKDYGSILTMMPEIREILFTKTDLGLLHGIAGFTVNALTDGN